MKKTLLLIGIAFFFLSEILAQEASFGAKAGANLANLTGDVGSSDMKFGVAIGGYTHIMFSDQIGATAELLYSGKGASGSGGDLSLNYIEIPLLLRYMVTEEIFANAGLAPSFLLSAKSGSTDVKSAYKGADIGWAIGGGYQLDNGLGIGARYTASLGSIAEPIDLGFLGKTEPDIKNSVIQIFFTYALGGG